MDFTMQREKYLISSRNLFLLSSYYQFQVILVKEVFKKLIYLNRRLLLSGHAHLSQIDNILQFMLCVTGLIV